MARFVGEGVFLEVGAAYRKYQAPMGRLVYVGNAPEGIERSVELAISRLKEWKEEEILVQFTQMKTLRDILDHYAARLDQIRINGEEKELVDDVVRLAKGYGITTPYTSYLIMPDAPIQVASADPNAAGGRLSRHHRGWIDRVRWTQ